LLDRRDVAAAADDQSFVSGEVVRENKHDGGV
jgi:hypothetical protein